MCDTSKSTNVIIMGVSVALEREINERRKICKK